MIPGNIWRVSAPNAFALALSTCNCYNADVNGDGLPSAFDMDPFVALLGSGNGGVYVGYEWDAENRLIAVTPRTPQAGDQKVEFAYDHMGRRVQKQVSTWNGTTQAWDLTQTRKFVWSGWLMLMELECDQPECGTGVSLVRSYTWGLDLAGQHGSVNSLEDAGGIGGLLAVQDAGLSEDYVYLYDANGNVGQMVAWAEDYGGTVDYEWDTAPAGNVRLVAHYEYDPYGNVVAQSGAYAAENPIRFSTKYWDDETGLGYWGYRYYSPRLGRWVNRDPLGESPDVNLHRYVANQPVCLIDPRGACSYTSDVHVGPSGDRPKAVDMAWTFTVGTDCCCHGALKFVQIIQEDWTIGGWLWKQSLRDLDSSFDPYLGWYPNVEDLGARFETGQVVGHRWRMGDTPGINDKKTSYLKQDFESCAVCVTGDGTGNPRVCVIACIRWGHEWQRGWSSTTHTHYGTGSEAGAPSAVMTEKLASLMAYKSGPLVWKHEGLCK